jgi:hypothetical protein
VKVFLRPTGLFSPAMMRVARALVQYAPDPVRVVGTFDEADAVVSHVICPGAPPVKPEIIIQYCLNSAECPYDWLPRWRQALMVWSYYDLGSPEGVNYYHAPLGVDAAFLDKCEAGEGPRDIPVMTSGCTTGPRAEAIEEPALAASSVGLRVLHLGPSAVEGMPATPPGWSSVTGISDCDLAALYRRTEWVSGLRHVEGFEMPVIEGLCCGARPIVFDRPDMTQWYEGHAAFVPECNGAELVEVLTEVFRHLPVPVGDSERAEVARKFDWGVIARGFWERLGV